MNRKVFISLLTLVCSFLAIYYILKYAFPEQFLLCLTNTNVLKFGNFLESNPIINEIVSNIMTILTFYLFSCACSSKKYLKLKQLLPIICIAIFTNYSYVFLFDYSVHISITAMLISSCICGGNIQQTTITYGVYGLSQLLIMKIRGIETILPILNKGCVYALGIEAVALLFLFYIIYNFKKEGGKNE